MIRFTAPLVLLALLLLTACGDAGQDSVPPVDDNEPEMIPEPEMLPEPEMIPEPEPTPDPEPELAVAAAEVTLRSVTDGVVPEDGIEVCVHEHPELPCGLGVSGTARLQAPTETRFHLRVQDSAGIYASMLFPVPSFESAGEIGVFLVPEAVFTASLEALEVSEDAERGHSLVAVLASTDDSREVEGFTVSPLEGESVGYISGSDPVDPELDSIGPVEIGGAAVFNVEPGQRDLGVSHPSSACRLAGTELGWFDEDAQALEMVIIPGHITFATLTCPEGSRDIYHCDPVVQDCSDPEQSKCSPVFFDDHDGLLDSGAACMPEGDKAIGELCERPNGVAGEDDCAAGGYCAYWGLPQSTPQQRQCLSICEGTEGCGEGQMCLGYGGGEASRGVCVDECDPFADACPEDTHCGLDAVITVSEQRWGFHCQFNGAGEEGDGCLESEHCAPGFHCVPGFGDGGSGQCRVLCDGNNGCDGAGCLPVLGAQGFDGLGVCPLPE